MQLPLFRSRFKTWLLSRLGTLRPRKNHMQLKATLELKSKGLSSKGLAVLSSRSRYFLLKFLPSFVIGLLCRGQRSTDLSRVAQKPHEQRWSVLSLVRGPLHSTGLITLPEFLPVRVFILIAIPSSLCFGRFMGLRYGTGLNPPR